MDNPNLTDDELASRRAAHARETLLGVPDSDGYPPVLSACDPSHEDYDPAGNDQEPTDG